MSTFWIWYVVAVVIVGAILSLLFWNSYQRDLSLLAVAKEYNWSEESLRSRGFEATYGALLIILAATFIPVVNLVSLGIVVLAGCLFVGGEVFDWLRKTPIARIK